MNKRKPRARISIDKKIQIAQQIENHQQSINGAARELGVSPSAVSQWCHQYRHNQLMPKANKRELELEKENQKLKETIGSLYFFIEQLKKMADSKQRMKDANSSIITERNLSQFLKPVK